jgi:hypothetical protein
MFCAFLAVGAMTLIVHEWQLAESNAYAGFLPVDFGVSYIAAALVSFVILALLMPVELRVPSDFFRAIYGMFVPLPFALFHVVDQPMVLFDFVWRMLLLLSPMLVVALVATVRIRLVTLPLFSQGLTEILLVGMCAAGAAFAVLYAPSAASFSIDTVYDRRIEARDIFVGGSVLSYAVAICVNGLVPCIAFIAGLRRRWWLGAASVVLGLAFFYVSGYKAQFAYVFLAYFLGVAVRRDRMHWLYRIIFLAIIGMFAIFLLEYVAMDYSITAELAFRRIFEVPSHVMNSYFHLMFEETNAYWSPLTGISNAPDGVTFLVGELYFGSDRYNVNTNAFIYALAAGGIPAYLAALALVGGTLALFDAIYRGTGNLLVLYLGFAFSLLLAEQAATTVLVSSGIALMTMLALASSGIRLGRPSSLAYGSN